METEQFLAIKRYLNVMTDDQLDSLDVAIFAQRWDRYHDKQEAEWEEYVYPSLIEDEV